MWLFTPDGSAGFFEVAEDFGLGGCHFLVGEGAVRGLEGDAEGCGFFCGVDARALIDV